MNLGPTVSILLFCFVFLGLALAVAANYKATVPLKKESTYSVENILDGPLFESKTGLLNNRTKLANVSELSYSK